MKRYATIVADPPWPYPEGWPVTRIPRGAVHDGRRTPMRYPAMDVSEIVRLPVQALAAKSAHLYLWTTNRYLFSAESIVAAWGFRYAQTLVWAKTPQGIGPGGIWSQNVEYVIFARRGSLRSLRRLDTCWFNWPRTGAHSRKPPHFLDMVETVSPGPYLELFARRNRLGWDTWGNECLNHVDLAP